MYKLLSAKPSPYARKVRIHLAEKGIPFELITEVPWNQGAVTAKYNPLAKLPVLLLEDGSSIYDSRFILEYLELIYPQTQLLPSDVEGRLAAKHLEVLADGVVSDAERETLRLIAQIAADGDKAINQLNACITAYEQVREQINGQ